MPIHMSCWWNAPGGHSTAIADWLPAKTGLSEGAFLRDRRGHSTTIHHDPFRRSPTALLPNTLRL
jgi:hypothetical protein